MTPALTFDDLYLIANDLAAGFESLLQQVQNQQTTERKLRFQLERLERLEEGCEGHGTSTEPSSIEISDWREEIVKQIAPPRVNPDSFRAPAYSDEILKKAHVALSRLQNLRMPVRNEVRRCPVAHKKPNQDDLEQDFTTQGTQGDLGCPFAQMQGDLAPCGTDPIAAEFHGDKSSTRSPDNGLGRCPIRFLDQHSPEEVAQYFENHKHEIPRSHEICVKRYQANDHSVRQLDAKYGNLVSMIQGLGTKHKQYLPEDEKVEDEPGSNSNKAVEKWAENISHEAVPAEDTERVPRFEQTLRDVRVGESPSRPWGIQVPVDHSTAASVSPSVNGGEQSAKPSSTVPALAQNTPEVISEPKPEPTNLQTPSPQSQIIFNGPVFFGYSAEQAAIFLKNLNIGATK